MEEGGWMDIWTGTWGRRGWVDGSDGQEHGVDEDKWMGRWTGTWGGRGWLDGWVASRDVETEPEWEPPEVYF